MRKLKPRQSVIPDDKHWLTCREVRDFLGFSVHTFKKLLPMWQYYGIPRPMLLGQDQPEDIRFYADELYSLNPNKDPYRDRGTGVTTTWMERFRQRQRVDRDAHSSSTSSANRVAA